MNSDNTVAELSGRQSVTYGKTVVKLTLTHAEFGPDSATHETTSHGWPAIMSSLKSLLESGTPLPFSGLGFGPSSRE